MSPRVSADRSSTPDGSSAHQHLGAQLPTSPSLPSIGAIGPDSSNGVVSAVGLPADNPKLESRHTSGHTSDSMSGLRELIAPTLSDTGGSSSSSISASISASISSSCHGGVDSSFGHHAAVPNNRYPPLPPMHTEGSSPFLGGGGTSPPHHSGGGGSSSSNNRLPSSSVAAVAALSSLPIATGHNTRRAPSRSTRNSLTPTHSAPIGSIDDSAIQSCPPRDLPPRAKSLGEIPGGAIGGFEPTGGGSGGGGGGHNGLFPERTAMAGSMGNSFVGGTSSSNGRQHPAGSSAAAPPPRGPLPMSLDARSKAHLRMFMRTAGSLVLLPGTDAIRGAIYGDAKDPDKIPEAAAVPAAGGAEDGTEGGGRPEESGAGGGGTIVDVFTEVCRAEAWAAVAVGALFSGASEEEGNKYLSRSLRAMSRCLDAPLPEVSML